MRTTTGCGSLRASRRRAHLRARTIALSCQFAARRRGFNLRSPPLRTATGVYSAQPLGSHCVRVRSGGRRRAKVPIRRPARACEATGCRRRVASRRAAAAAAHVAAAPSRPTRSAAACGRRRQRPRQTRGGCFFEFVSAKQTAPRDLRKLGVASVRRATAAAAAAVSIIINCSCRATQLAGWGRRAGVVVVGTHGAAPPRVRT